MTSPAGQTAEGGFVAVPARLIELATTNAISPLAAWAYVALLKHINRSSGHTRVWPSRSTLAAALGLKNARSVDRYVAELERADLLTVERRRADNGVNETNVYVLHMTWGGGGALQNTTPRPAETTISAAPGVVSQSAPGVVSQSAPGVVSQSAHDLEGFDLEEINPSSRPRFALFLAHGATADEERRVIERVKSLSSGIRDLKSYLERMDGKGEIAAILKDVRAAERERSTAAWKRSLDGLPRCPHEFDGGKERDPTTGKMACAHCDRRNPRPNNVIQMPRHAMAG